MYTLIFLTLFIGGWLVCGFLPWLVISVATRGNAGLLNLPLAMFAGVVAGLAVPVLGADDASGIWWSFVAALVVPSVLLAARRFSLHHPVQDRTPAPEPPRK